MEGERGNSERKDIHRTPAKQAAFSLEWNIGQREYTDIVRIPSTITILITHSRQGPVGYGLCPLSWAYNVTTQLGAAQHSTNSTPQHITAQYSTLRCRTVQYSKVDITAHVATCLSWGWGRTRPVSSPPADSSQNPCCRVQDTTSSQVKGHGHKILSVKVVLFYFTMRKEEGREDGQC